MKSPLSKTQAKDAIARFFQRSSWQPEELRKIKRVAMKYRIKLRDHKKLFCKQCLMPLKGKMRVTKAHKSVVCEKCGANNRRDVSGA